MNLIRRKDASQNILAGGLVPKRKYKNLIINLPLLSELDDKNFFNEKLKEGFKILRKRNQ